MIAPTRSDRSIVSSETRWKMETAEIDDARTHSHSIKLPAAVEVFANLKNAQKFAIDIGMYSYPHTDITVLLISKLFDQHSSNFCIILEPKSFQFCWMHTRRFISGSFPLFSIVDSRRTICLAPRTYSSSLNAVCFL